MARDLIAYLMILSLFMTASGCHKESDVVISHSSRDKLVDVSQQVRVFNPDGLPMSSSHAYVVVAGRYILVKDFRSVGKMIHLLDKDTWEYVGSAGDLGQGPCEISNLGSVAIDERNDVLLVTDLGGSRVLRYEIDSVRSLHDCLPSVKTRFDSSTIPITYQYINDTLSYGVIGMADYSSNTIMQMAGIWNMSTGEVKVHNHVMNELKAFRVGCAYSESQQKLIECDKCYDLINVFDKDLNLIFRIKGPQWDAEGDSKRHFGDVVCYDDKFIAAYEGSEYERQNHATKCHVFSMNGDYILTLDVGRSIWHLSMDEENARLYFTFADDVIQFGYLDLKGLL